MFQRKQQYTCPLCRWQGTQEPTEPHQGAMCPQCGNTMYPLTWAQTWGVALVLIGLAILVVLVAAYGFR